MNKTQIKIVIIGHLRHSLDFKKIKQNKSSFFEICQIETINNIPSSENDNGYLDITYSRKETENILNNVNFEGIVLGIMNYRFDDNFYMHRSGDNKLCLSIADIDILLLNNGISLENFILKNIYEIVVFKNALNDLTSDDIYNLIHQDTRMCLFDMNGDKYDVVYNTEKPIICDECKTFLNKKSLPENFIKTLEKELKKIKKPLLCTVEIFIKKYPLLSILLTVLSTIIINLISNGIWELLKKCLTNHCT